MKISETLPLNKGLKPPDSVIKTGQELKISETLPLNKGLKHSETPNDHDLHVLFQRHFH